MTRSVEKNLTKLNKGKIAHVDAIFNSSALANTGSLEQPEIKQEIDATTITVSYS